MIAKRVHCIILFLCLIFFTISCNQKTNNGDEPSDTSKNIELNDYGYIPLDSLPDDYTVNEAVTDGVINISNGGIDNEELFTEFFNNVKNSVDSMIRMLQYTTEGDPVYTDVIYHCNNVEHTYFEFREKNMPAETFDYITTDGRDIYLSNEVEYNKSTDAKPICFTALTVDKNIWENTIQIIQDIMTNEIQTK